MDGLIIGIPSNFSSSSRCSTVYSPTAESCVEKGERRPQAVESIFPLSSRKNDSLPQMNTFFSERKTLTLARALWIDIVGRGRCVCVYVVWKYVCEHLWEGTSRRNSLFLPYSRGIFKVPYFNFQERSLDKL